jgi:hypothetical protein
VSAVEYISKFPRGVRLEITVVFEGEYRVGYRYRNIHYLPGTPSYYPLDEAMRKCYEAFRKTFPSEVEL